MIHNYLKVGKRYLIFCLILGFLLSTNLALSQCPKAPGNENKFGDGSWIGYVYGFSNNGNPPTDTFNKSNYRGFITQPEIFDQNLGNGSLPVTADLCTTSADLFAVRYKLKKTYAAGSYQITVGGDDGYRLFINGTLQTTLSNWTDHAYTTSTDVLAFNGGNVEFEFEYYEKFGGSRVSFDITLVCTTNTTAPTSISGSNICAGGSTTLSAIGGVSGANSFFEWEQEQTLDKIL